jgi:cytochrome c-type biogenesis protein CcmF
MTVLGQVVLVLAGVLSLGAAVGYGRIVPGRTGSLVLPRMLMATSTTLVVIASAILTALFLTHDFSNGYVFAYSDRSLPLHFLLSSFYAGQEGSFLFWVLCSSLIAVALSGFSRKRDAEAEVMTVFLLVQAVLIGLSLFKSPFVSIWAKYPDLPIGQLPADGRGLNPLLQNFWMVIHPPVLFIGFSLMAVPYSQAIAGLWKRKPLLLSEQGLSWTLLAVSILGLGIMLGAYWAYGVLGWGGYWGWDPVENSSLVPWITGAALVHTLVAQRRTGRYIKTNLALAVVSFFLVIYSTFLTRSGILGDASVHAFADGGAGIYWLLLSFMTVICCSGIFFIILRAKDLAGEMTTGGWLTRETLLAAGSIVLLLSAAVVLFGTSLPIFSATRVETSFYDSTNLPLAILIALLIGLSLYTQWEEHDARYTARKLWKALLAAIIATVLCVAFGMHDVATGGLVFTAFFALFVNVDTGVRILGGDPLFLGGKIAHIGLAIFFIGVVATGKYSTKEHVVLPRGTPVQALGHTLTYTGFNVTKDQKYIFDVRADRGTTSFILNPVMFTAGEQGIMRNPDIMSGFTHDFYMSPQSLEPPQDGSTMAEVEFEKGQERQIGDATVTFTGFEMGGHTKGSMSQEEAERGVAALLTITQNGREETLKPRLVPGGDTPVHTGVPSNLLGADVQLLSMNISMGEGASQVTIGIEHAGQQAPKPDVLVVEASIKPFVNLLWAGTVLMMIGFALAIVKRWRE